ncbi:MAG: DedA family protein [Verrucomicrobiae bacterium]|nr:DedA family protein [Verrucomicrobiae bacterium]
MLTTFLDIIIHLDKHLAQITSDYGAWTYLIVFLVIFCETGLVVTPFLPGDSLLFAIGAIAALGSLDLGLLAVLLIIAAVVGDSVNYQIGKALGPRVMNRPDSRWLRKEHLERTHAFFEKYGGKTIIIARFVPIVRTFAPFVAGVGAMTYRRFLLFNVIGGVVWVLGFLLAGYFFGNMPVVKKNFTLVILAIIAISLLPGVIEYWRARRAKRAAVAAAKGQDVL